MLTDILESRRYGTSLAVSQELEPAVARAMVSFFVGATSAEKVRRRRLLAQAGLTT